MPLPNLNPPVLSLQGVDASYGSLPVLKNVSFTVDSGQFIGIIGPNGGGKTTLLKLILGLLKPSKGTISLFDEPAGSPKILHRLAYVPQVARFDREFPISVKEVVLLGLLSSLPWYGRFSKASLEKMDYILEKLALIHLKNQPFGRLSGGQAQRVLIARALISNPELLLLDEPTASVDREAEAAIYAILSELKGKMTILMVTHDLKTAIERVESVLCVQGSVSSLSPQVVCTHFSFGLYHQPVISAKD